MLSPLQFFPVILAVLALAPACPLLAQSSPTPYNKSAQWFAWSGDHAFHPQWALHFDTGWRQLDGSAWNQFLLRPGLNFQPHRNIQLSTAYSFFDAHPEGLRVRSGEAPEHRLQEQFQATHRASRLPLRHRVRIDHRWLGTPWAEGHPRLWNLQHRLRYLLRTDIPLVKSANEAVLVYLGLYDEVFLRYGFSGVSHFEQNRIYAGVGFRPPGRKTSLEVGVFHQRFKPLGGGPLENNYVLIMTIANQTPLGEWFRRKPAPALARPVKPPATPPAAAATSSLNPPAAPASRPPTS